MRKVSDIIMITLLVVEFNDEINSIDKRCLHPQVLKWVECEVYFEWFHKFVLE